MAENSILQTRINLPQPYSRKHTQPHRVSTTTPPGQHRLRPPLPLPQMPTTILPPTRNPKDRDTQESTTCQGCRCSCAGSIVDVALPSLVVLRKN